MKRLPALLALIAGIAAILVIAKYANRGGQSAALPVKTVTVHRTTFRTKLPENGVVQHPRTATIPTLIAGNIAAIYVGEGAGVAQGQLLATIENPSLESTAAGSQADYTSAEANIRTARIDEQNARVGYQAQVQTAKSNLDEAQRVYDADVALFRNKAIPRNQVDTDRASLEKMRVAYDQAVRQLRLGAVTGYGENSVQYAQAAAEKASITNQANQQQIGFTRITAPFSGVIQSVATQANDPLTPLRPGDPVTQGQMLFTIADTSGYIVKAQVDEQDIINVHVGQAVIVSGQDFPGKQVFGHVAVIAPTATRSTDASSTAKQVLTTIRLDSSPSYLREGMTVDVDILTSDIRNAITVPNDAISNDGGASYVFVVHGNLARRTRVRTGASNDSQTVITSGLAPGEAIVAEKVPALRDGDRVTPAPSSSPAGAP
ncbi:MAG TPA: efflux RND transporter periplasmic adaptor subunit [Candidatus Baltobacteraceae bacterium]|jgi:HlyD family secretion protein|nr:efflux RND transporter periplasmic adaptor subunit [Candidatus Baltobacteraceae bacterium]